MMTAKMMPAAASNDTELVSASLDGNRDAFGQIVSRYQSLVCSLAYSATGSLTASEDLAQETFVTAWKQLAGLREPEKLRAWLCGIARNLIHNSLRRQGREPSHRAESLEEVSESHAPGPLPADQAISNEEAAILWRSLERIPETYREPLVLFYREHQSIETVAQNLELTEDAVKQRLSRGRKLLQEEVLAFVEGALARTNPGQAFTLGVLAGLPAMVVSAKAATLGAAAKGGAAIKGAGLMGLSGTLLIPLLPFYGMWRHYRSLRKAGYSDRERKIYRNSYLGIAVSVVVFVLITCVFESYAGMLLKKNPWLFAASNAGLILSYFLLIAGIQRRFFRAAKKEYAELPPAEAAARLKKIPGWEYRSRFELLGLPFIHIRIGFPHGCEQMMTTKWKPVRAWIAIADSFAFGLLFAYAAVPVAPVSIGACAIGLLSYGAVAIGAVAVGGFGFGIWAAAGFAFGWQAIGDTAIAWHTACGGQYAVAHDFASAATAYAAQANNDLVEHAVKSSAFFRFCRTTLRPCGYWLLWAWAIPAIFLMLAGWRARAKRRRLDRQTEKST